MNSSSRTGRKALSPSKQQWRRLMVIALSGSAMIATPQLAHAAFTEDPPASGQYTASGAENTTQSLVVNNAQVTTDNTFSVTAPTGIALHIAGAGALSYTDTNGATLLTNGPQYALNMDVTGDAPGPVPGSITIETNGNITGGGGVNAVNSGSGSIQVTTTGIVTGTDSNANGMNIVVGVNGADLEVNAAQVSGGNFGIITSNQGSGDTNITTTGTISGTANSGIRAFNGATAGDLIINTTGDVTSSNNHGIDAENNGTGNLEVTTVNASGLQNGVQAVNAQAGNLSIVSTGTLSGTNNSGVNATNGTGTGNLTVEANIVTGGQFGIATSNSGTGDTTITTNGIVTGTGNSGIRANNATTSTGALTVTANANVVSTGNHGIDVENSGTGDTTVTAGTVNGLQNAIQAVNHTGGDLIVTSTGTLTGTNNSGVNATNSAGGVDLTVTANTVIGGQYGIITSNSGTGDTTITTNGVVTATNNSGIRANNATGTTVNLTVTANDAVTGGNHGIDAENNGTGTTQVNVNGTVTGTSGNGVNAVAGAAAGNLGVTVADGVTATGGDYGVATRNNGLGTTTINIDGIAEGGDGGVLANSSASQAIAITVNGTVRNSSQDSDDLAIYSDTSPVTINNNNFILGTVSLDNQGNTFNNDGNWNTAGGSSTLGTGVNTLDNRVNSNILAATATGGPVNTTVTGVGTFIHSGELVLQNEDFRIGGLTSYTGDVATFTNGGSGEFQSNDGTLYIDTDLENSTSDSIAVDNVVVTGGATRVYVNAFGPGRATSGDGIEVVDVAGTSENDAFVLGAPIQAGLFDYNLGQGSSDTQSWFLQSSLRDEVVSAGALTVLGSRTALATLSNLNERQRGGEGFTDEQDGRKGIWARAFGQDSKFRSDGGSNAGFNANTWGAQAGLDLLAQEKENGARKYAGVYIGYATSNGDALNGSSRVGRLDVDATSVGAYFTKYSPKGWYADATAQFSKLDGVRIRTADNSLDPDGKSYAVSLELGQRFNPEKEINPELQAQLIYQKTDIDDVTLSDSTRLNIGNINAVTGRLGVRLSKNPEYAGRFQPWVRVNLWHTFKTGARINSQGAGVDTHVGGTSGEVQLGFALAPSQAGGWSAYVAGGYLFDLGGSEYSGWKGTLGVRKGW